MQPTRFQLSNSEATYPCCASCCSPLQPHDLSLSVSQSVGASASDGHIQMVQRYNQSRIAFPGLFSVKKKTKKNIYITKYFLGQSIAYAESRPVLMAVQVSRIGQYGALVSLTVGATPAFSVLASSTLACGICFVVGELNVVAAQVRYSAFVHY